MTWIQDFEVAPGAKFTDEQAVSGINKHSQDNLKIFKSVIEAEANKGKSSGCGGCGCGCR